MDESVGQRLFRESCEEYNLQQRITELEAENENIRLGQQVLIDVRNELTSKITKAEDILKYVRINTSDHYTRDKIEDYFKQD